jgi:hypothetical protein
MPPNIRLDLLHFHIRACAIAIGDLIVAREHTESFGAAQRLFRQAQGAELPTIYLTAWNVRNVHMDPWGLP